MKIILCSLGLIAATMDSVSAATVIYAISGGAITGSLNGTPFIGTSFSISALGDSSAVRSGMLNSENPPEYPLEVSPVEQPVVVINTTTGPLTATFPSNTSPYSWHAISLIDISYTFCGFAQFYDFPQNGFSAGLVGFGSPTIPIELDKPGVYYSHFDLDYSTVRYFNFNTSSGNLSFLTTDPELVAFSVSSTPEPSSVMSSILVSLAGYFTASRRRIVRLFSRPAFAQPSNARTTESVR
jgi:hypothetical protein